MCHRQYTPRRNSAKRERHHVHFQISQNQTKRTITDNENLPWSSSNNSECPRRRIYRMRSHRQQQSHQTNKRKYKKRAKLKPKKRNKNKSTQTTTHTRTTKQNIPNETRNKKVTVTCKVNRYTPKTTFRAQTTQFPINLADAVTGHKLQGRTLNKMIVASWNSNFPNWHYTVLSRVKSLDDLYLLEPINEQKSYAASPHFKAFIKRIQKTEEKTMNNSYITYND